MGNGFDLASTLKSTYRHFFSERIGEKVKKQLDEALSCFKIQMVDSSYFGYDTIFRVKEPDERFEQERRTIQNLRGTSNHDIYGIIQSSDLTF